MYEETNGSSHTLLRITHALRIESCRSLLILNVLHLAFSITSVCTTAGLFDVPTFAEHICNRCSARTLEPFRVTSRHSRTRTLAPCFEFTPEDSLRSTLSTADIQPHSYPRLALPHQPPRSQPTLRQDWCRRPDPHFDPLRRLSPELCARLTSSRSYCRFGFQ